MKTKSVVTTALALVLAGCSSQTRKETQQAQAEAPAQRTFVTEVEYQQIERFGRPAINEGLITENALLNIYNSVPPSIDKSEAATPVRSEAVRTISAVFKAVKTIKYGVAPTQAEVDAHVNKIAGAFLPDVMRIDTRVNHDPATLDHAKGGAYVGCASSSGILCGGRMIEDDVVDATLATVAGDTLSPADGPGLPIVTTDNVSYKGENSTCQGHQKLHAAADYGQAATFPYLAKPN